MNKALSYLGAAVAILATLFGAAIKVGQWQQRVTETERRLDALESDQHYFHGDAGPSNAPAPFKRR